MMDDKCVVTEVIGEVAEMLTELRQHYHEVIVLYEDHPDGEPVLFLKAKGDLPKGDIYFNEYI